MRLSLCAILLSLLPAISHAFTVTHTVQDSVALEPDETGRVDEVFRMTLPGADPRRVLTDATVSYGLQAETHYTDVLSLFIAHSMGVYVEGTSLGLYFFNDLLREYFDDDGLIPQTGSYRINTTDVKGRADQTQLAALAAGVPINIYASYSAPVDPSIPGSFFRAQTSVTYTYATAAVPVPPAFGLLAFGVMGLVMVRRKGLSQA